MPTFQVSRLGRKLESRAKSVFGYTQNPIEAGYITRDGKYLNFPSLFSSHIPDREHIRIMAVLPTKSKNTSYFLNETGDIRTQITKENASFEIRKPLSDEQLEAIGKASEGRRIFIDYTNDKGETIKSSQFSDYPTARSWIERNVR